MTIAEGATLMLPLQWLAEVCNRNTSYIALLRQWLPANNPDATNLDLGIELAAASVAHRGVWFDYIKTFSPSSAW